MRIGTPKEIKNQEYRVGITPANARELSEHGHDVMVETGAGDGIGMRDADYEAAGARIVPDAATVFAEAEMVVKVKEPQAGERAMLRPGQILFTYLHLAPDPDQTRDLVDSGAVCIAYETVTSPMGGLPLLAPMSEVAGRLSIQAGAYYLEKAHGGHGVLLGGVPGVDPAKVDVLGGGVVGTHAIDMALGLGADVWVIDRNVHVLRAKWQQYGKGLNTVFSTRDAVERHVMTADLVIGGVLIPGAAAPKLVTAGMVKKMKPGSVVLDMAVEFGGNCEVSEKDKTVKKYDVTIIGEPNLPSLVPTHSSDMYSKNIQSLLNHIGKEGKVELNLEDEIVKGSLITNNGEVIHERIKGLL